MRYIAHRGNINGRNIGRENTVSYIEEALRMGYDVEVDVWKVGEKWFLGHDAPEHETSELFVNNPKLWVHCKNHEALSSLLKTRRYGFPNCFFHNTDAYTITSMGYIWAYPGSQLCGLCVSVMPETVNYTMEQLTSCYGICSDVVGKYR